MRKLTIIGKNLIREGTSRSTGKPWTLYGVEALDERGAPITQLLKTFSNLPLGEVEVEVEVQESEEYGPSYLLKPLNRGGGNRGSGGGGGAASAALEQRIVKLEAEVKRLSSIVDRRDPGLPVASPSFGPSPGIPTSDDDIPF